MEELIGYCRACDKPVYCKMGFLDGIVQEDKSLLCFDCSGEGREDKGDLKPESLSSTTYPIGSPIDGKCTVNLACFTQ